MNAMQSEQIKAWWLEGRTAKWIANELGVTRNSICGHVHRRGYSRDSEVTASVGGRRIHRNKLDRERRAAFRFGDAYRADKYARQPPPVQLAQWVDSSDWVKSATCKWPMGTDILEPDYYCNARTALGYYCSEHARMAYQKRR